MSCVTLLTDFGIQDGNTAFIKAVLMSHISHNTPIVDISHSVEPFNVQQAAYLLRSNFNIFPVNTFHLVPINVFYDKHPQLILGKVQDHFILAPNNGILQFFVRHLPGDYWVIHTMDESESFKNWLKVCAQTIHVLSQHPEHIDNFFKLESLQPLPLTKPDFGKIHTHISCEIIHIDRYENLVLDITRDEFEQYAQGRPFRIQLIGTFNTNKIVNRYADVEPGQVLSRFNHAGFLEIAINKGNAATLLGFSLAKQRSLFKHHIQIVFE